jgi:hypothetical protein
LVSATASSTEFVGAIAFVKAFVAAIVLTWGKSMN